MYVSSYSMYLTPLTLLFLCLVFVHSDATLLCVILGGSSGEKVKQKPP